MIHDFITMTVTALIVLTPIVNPIGALVSYAGFTAQWDRKEAQRQALLTSIYVFAIMASFSILGSLILEVFGIDLASIQIAGGFVVAHSGFNLLSPREELSPEEKSHITTKKDISFTPMALPLIAGPGVIGECIALVARHTSYADRAAVVFASAIIAVIILLLLRYGAPLVTRMGPTGVGAMTRLVGFLILCIGAEIMIHGFLALPWHSIIH